MTGRDGLVRGAKLKVYIVLAKGRKQTVIHRPLQKLIAFEIAESVGERECGGEVEINDENETARRIGNRELQKTYTTGSDRWRKRSKNKSLVLWLNTRTQILRWGKMWKTMTLYMH